MKFLKRLFGGWSFGAPGPRLSDLANEAAEAYLRGDGKSVDRIGGAVGDAHLLPMFWFLMGERVREIRAERAEERERIQGMLL